VSTVERIEAEDLLALAELRPVVGGRTIEILERRRRTKAVRRRGWLVRRLLLVADVVGLIAAFLLAELIVNYHGGGSALESRVEVLVFVLTIPGWIVIAKLYGLYDRDEERTDNSTTDDFAGLFHMITVSAWLFWAFSRTTKITDPTPTELMLFWLAAIVFVSVGRAVARAIARRHVLYLQNTVIVGAGTVGQLIAKKLLQHPEYGINLVGFVDAETMTRRADLEHLPLLGTPERLPSIIRVFDVERVIVAFSAEAYATTLDRIRELKDHEVQVDIVPRFFEVVGPGVGIHTIEGLPLIGLPPSRLPQSSQLLKRAMDLSLACIGAIVLAPLYFAIALAIKLDSRGPVFFRQVRMGSNERTFRIWKFRTMRVDAEARKHELAHLNKHARSGDEPRMFKITDDPRITRVGRVLRRFSLDELPQLFNVIRGEMSLVGPRPLVLDEDQHVASWRRRRLDLKPGMTGLWQVLGRDEIPFEEMVRLDYLYVMGWSAWHDMRLLLKTIPAVTRRGV
jgi:exopolysaccharide biosynthesis polyprenyl glycosylphosphotransferase